jgi:hypothetical protein
MKINISPEKSYIYRKSEEELHGRSSVQKISSFDSQLLPSAFTAPKTLFACASLTVSRIVNFASSVVRKIFVQTSRPFEKQLSILESMKEGYRKCNNRRTDQLSKIMAHQTHSKAGAIKISNLDIGRCCCHLPSGL